MKKTVAKTMLAVLALVAPAAVKADLIWYEGFNYANGNLTNVSSGTWINFSGSGLKDMYVNNGKLEVSTTGNAITSRADDDRRPLATVASSPYTNSVQVLYASFTVICTNLPNGAGSYLAAFYNPKSGTGGGFYGRIQAFTNGTVLPNTWRLGASANTLGTNAANGGYPVDLALNTPYQVVEELDPTSSGLQAATIWINPINVSQTGSSPVETHYTTSDSIGASVTYPVTDFAFRQASSFGNGFWVITNLALATSFAEAATNVWSTNAVVPVMVRQPVGTTNYTGAAFILAAIVNGQSLGNLTYQWQLNGQNYTGGNGGTSNVLAISSAQVGDSGNYTLIATTPYGLSVTSTVAKVSISDAPVPPTFVTQPTSVSVYVGQTAIFSCSVISPGNVSYQWYSNNVAISGANAATLELDHVAPSFAAAYKVAVTNDVAVNGVVSTNALLTIKTPTAVSVAYLRKLVDPLTYQPTNTPATIAYQVTGVVTTSTNITTGDTSSYYLQDGTAGINIFVTGGSTFRPALGDEVTFVGVLSSYTSGLELFADASATTVYPFTSFTVLSNNIAGLPSPISIPFTVMNDVSNANYNLGGSLVKISDVYFGARAGTTISATTNDTVTVTNTTGQTFRLFFPYLDLDVAGQTLPNYAYSVSGVLYSQNSVVTNTIVVTSFANVVTNNTTPAPIPLTFNVAGSSLTFNWTDSSFVLQSATNVAGPYNTISGAATGFVTNATTLPTLFFRLYHP